MIERGAEYAGIAVGGFIVLIIIVAVGRSYYLNRRRDRVVPQPVGVVPGPGPVASVSPDPLRCWMYCQAATCALSCTA